MAKSTGHDVIIVGASVAGCRTARTLADAGIRVLLLDRSRFARRNEVRLDVEKAG